MEKSERNVYWLEEPVVMGDWQNWRVELRDISKLKNELIVAN